MTLFNLVEIPGKDKDENELGPVLRGPATVVLEASVLKSLIPDFSPQHNEASGEVEFTFKFK